MRELNSPRQSILSRCGTAIEMQETERLDFDLNANGFVAQPTNRGMYQPHMGNFTRGQESGGSNVVSLVLGIISFVTVGVLQIFTLPMSIVGLVLGLVSKRKGGLKIAGIVLSSLSALLAIPILILYYYLLYGSNVPIHDSWKCSEDSRMTQYTTSLS